jgi:hypothetical protein
MREYSQADRIGPPPGTAAALATEMSSNQLFQKRNPLTATAKDA